MSTFIVKVYRPECPPVIYPAIGPNSAALIIDAQDRYFPCTVFVKPVQ